MVASRSGSARLAHVGGVGQAQAADGDAGPLQRAVHGRDGRAELFGDLGGGEVEHVAQHQRGALPSWQPLHRGDPGQPQIGAARRRRSGASGKGSSQGDVERRPQRRLGVPARRAEPGRQRPAAA